MHAGRAVVAFALVAILGSGATGGGRSALESRVPPESIEAARNAVNPLARSLENVGRGRSLYLGKGFCATCHGRDGRGFGPDVDRTALRGALPRDFTDRDWQRVRSDGELHWILRHGSPGTAMAPFVPLVLSEEEAWLVLLYVRTLRMR